MAWEETGGGSTQIRRYAAPATRYSPPPADDGGGGGGGTPPAVTVQPVLDAPVSRFAVLPNELAALSRVTNLSINNDSETAVTFVTTDGIMSWAEGVTRDLANLNKIYVTGLPTQMIFELAFVVEWAADADGYRQVAIDNNDGSAYRILSAIPAVATASIKTVQNGSIKLRRQAVDTYYSLKVRHTAGAALNITAAQFSLL